MEQYGPEKRAEVLQAYGQCGNVLKACKEAGIGRVTFYRWLRTEESFQKQFEECKLLVAQTLEDEVVRRGYEGVDQPVYQGGKLVGEIRKYSDLLLIFYLKGLLPDKYKDRVSTEHTVTEDLAQRIQAARKRAAGEKPIEAPEANDVTGAAFVQ